MKIGIWWLLIVGVAVLFAAGFLPIRICQLNLMPGEMVKVLTGWKEGL